MSTRKEKVDKANKRRQERTVVNPLANAVQQDITDRGSVDAFTAPATAIKNDSELANSRAIRQAKGVRAEDLGYTIKDGVVQSPLDIQNKGLEQHASKGATQQQAQTINIPQVQSTEEEKAPTLLDLTSKRLAELRQKAETEKTDAAKMQKYHALTDVFNALGKMGGAAIGGAIGGNALDSAPIVGEYQPSRGYLDAVEKYKQANDRLKALDEKEFQLAVRDEDRSYKQQMDKLNRDYQKWMADYKNQIDRANAEENFARQQELAEYKAQKDLEYKERVLALQNQYDMATKAASKANMQLQHDLYNTVPIAFVDGTGLRMSKNDYEAMQRFFTTKGVSKDEIDEYIANNPQLVNDFITATSGAYTPTKSAAQTTTQTKQSNGIPVASEDNADSANPNQPKEAVTPIPSVSIMSEYPTISRRMDERNQRIAQKQADKNTKVQELMEEGLTEQEAKRKVRVDKRIAKATAKYGVNGSEQGDTNEHETSSADTGSNMTVKEFESKWGLK